MNDTAKITFWIFLCWLFTTLLSQETHYLDSESEPAEYLQLIDGEPLILNGSYCLNQITTQTITKSFHGDDSRRPYYIKIMWDSKAFMTSIKVESDSLNDSYCEPENKHYYYRKPLNQSFHVFPDEVHEGIRFLPIKLDCKYVITPELDGMCRALRLRYSTPVCIDNNTCTCRNVNMSGPILEGKLDKNGVNLFWYFPENYQSDVSSIVISIYSEDGINIKKLLKKKMGITDFSTASSIKYKQYFQMNLTSEHVYRIQGYFENKINCRGNSTFLLLRHPETLKRLNFEKVILYTMAFMFLLLFSLICLLNFWKKEVRRICLKLFFAESSEPAEVHFCSDNSSRKDLLPQMVWNPSYADQSRADVGCIRLCDEVFIMVTTVTIKELKEQGIAGGCCAQDEGWVFHHDNTQDSYLFDYRDLVIIKEIASGNFGIVYLAYSPTSLKGCNEFAIKQIKDKAGPEGITDFIEEINMFKLVGDHPNVVKMFGYCSTPQPLTIIMEYVPFNLLTYLKNLRAEFERKKSEVGSISYAKLSHSRTSTASLTDYNYISQNEVECMPLNNVYKTRDLEYVLDNTELEIFGLQIARGMSHLESRNIIHRDLAARNVLMDHAKVLKISDFGMSKTGIYVNRKSRKFPLRWMSPEALVNRVYSNKSDVWSFGVVLWEIGTLGAFPYSSLQNEEVISLLEKGGHLDKPENVTTQLYSVMVDCWALSPGDRPTFRDLVEKIESICQNGYVDFENLESNYVFPPMEEDIERKTELTISS